MKDPIKIIHKYKNNNRRIQYMVYIYIGSLVGKDIIEILNTIKDKDFTTVLNTLEEPEYQKLEKYYGTFWYEYFFLSFHLTSQKKLIDNTPKKKKEIMKKYKEKWYSIHIKQDHLTKVAYSFASRYYNELAEHKKVKTRKIDIDFRTYHIGNGNTMSGGNIKQLAIEYKSEADINNIKTYDIVHRMVGGTDIGEDTIEETVINDDDIVENITEEDFEEYVEEDFNLEELTNFYKTPDIETDKVIMETSKLIKDAIHDVKWEAKTDKLENTFDETFENITYDTKLDDVYHKIYITDQYIFKDDTVKTMRQKITVTIPLSKKFGKHIRLLPEAQYFWSEYIVENVTDYVMLGQKWIRRNELLKIDIKPNENIKIYEKLRDNLAYLKESFGYKIKRENDESNIIRAYSEYMTMNEIFMLDVYNDLGLNYNSPSEEKRNLYDVYINIYYPVIAYERFEQITDLLNDRNNKELSFIELQFNNIRNDVILETKIEETVEETKNHLKAFDKNFSQNYIILSIIHVNIMDPKNITGTTSDLKYNLYRIFDNFNVSEEYPFMQYQTLDSQLRYKIFTKTKKVENSELFAKWFENAPYGISFKIKLKSSHNTQDKYISINLHDNGRINYKVTWREDDEANIDNINETYDYVRELLTKINSENKKIKIMLPSNDKFKYAFINTIQKFTLPNNFKINHNDLSDFSRFFFPYVSMVVEPKKRKSKRQDIVNEASKYGTYLRYKRISKYDNRIKLQLRILYFLRNYDINDNEIIDEISKQFNITAELALKEINYVKEKYQKVIKRSSKLSKKLQTLPKSKPPGIGIDIQGRERDRYKIRITGARDKEQLDEIVQFMQVLIYLYTETYLFKNKDYQKIREMLKKLTNIAQRRNKVAAVVDYDATIKTVKSITSLDKARLGFKPEKGQSQWTRSCQNSGTDKKRRPDITPEDKIDKLIQDGYKMNKKTGYYEKVVEIKTKGKKYNTTIRAVKLFDNDTSTYNYYSCDPNINKEHFYIGFLSRGNNPNNLCMPCCFKKDHLTGHNKQKRNNFLKCLGENVKEDKVQETSLGDKLYILQETNKIQDGRFIYLPKYLDIFFNGIWKHDHKIKNHYLLESKSGYFFKYTIKHEYYYFLAAMANIYMKSIEEIMQHLIRFIEKDKDDRFFTYLNNGDISESFKNREALVEYIQTSNYLEYDVIGELCALPGAISEKGILYYILNKQIIIIKRALEKDELKEKYYLECLNPENNYQYNYDRDIVILIKEDKYYFPIYRVQKDEKINKKILLQKKYSNEKLQNGLQNVINELKKYHLKSCQNTLLSQIVTNNNLIGKNIIEKLKKININIKKQYIDDRRKCKYIELDNGLCLPIIPSGTSYEYPFISIRNKRSAWLDYKTTIKILTDIEKKLNLDYKPVTVFYDEINKNKIKIISILLNNKLTISILNETVDINDIKKLGLSVIFKPLEESIDNEIMNYDNTVIYDERSKRVKEHNYMNESYNLYRLELSLYLSNNDDIKESVINIVQNKKIPVATKKDELRSILFQIIDPKLAAEYKIITKELGNKPTMAFIAKNIPELSNYVIYNVRDYCNINTTMEKCNSNLQCQWKNNTCKLQLLENIVPDFINKIIEELVEGGIKYKELIQDGTYYVSDIVNYSQYTYRENQKIIIANNFNVNKLMSELFGKDKVPIIGKRQINKSTNNIIDKSNPELIELGKQLVQEIISNKDSIIRAYINSYYWINNPLYDIMARNIGYVSELQTNLTYIFKANIIDFIQNNLNQGDENVMKYLKQYFKNDDNFFESTLNKFRKTSFNTDGKLELYVLSQLIPNPIVVYDNFSAVKYLYLQGEVKITPETIANFTSSDNIHKTIFIKFEFDGTNTIPKTIYSIYYM